MKADMPLVSIGVPVYNGERFVGQTLESLLGQTYRNLEIVISDNGSTDSTERICREFAVKDTRVHYCRIDTTVDLYANFRRVLQLSSGDYFMWNAADDIRPPTAVQACVEALIKNPSAVMAHGPVLIRTPKSDQMVEIANEMDLSSAQSSDRIQCFTKNLQHNAVLYGLYARSALGKASLKSYSFGADYLVVLQMCSLGPVEYVRTPIIIYRQKSEPNTRLLDDLTLSLQKLIDVRGRLRRKAWAMLLLGCYYLMKIHGPGLKDKLQSAASHLVSFALRHQSRLLKEIVFLICWPVWVGSHVYRVGKEALTQR
jgi:glycosyltransferase involved in cell wall biosynthesis